MSSAAAAAGLQEVPLQGACCRMPLACSRPLSWRMPLVFGAADSKGKPYA